MKLLPRPTRTPVRTDDNIGRGMDLALTVLVFLGIGFGLDMWLDTKPVFMIVLTLVAVAGKGVSMYYSYDATMRAVEADREAAIQAAPRFVVERAEEPTMPNPFAKPTTERHA